jgi:hypothetical protein
MALKKIIAPTIRVRELEILRDFQAVYRGPKGMSIEVWLLK